MMKHIHTHSQHIIAHFCPSEMRFIEFFAICCCVPSEAINMNISSFSLFFFLFFLFNIFK